MKQALILHGTDGKPDSNWFPWLKAELEECDYEVWVPLLPDNHAPNRQTYNDFLLNSGHDFTDNIVVGHSSGAVEVLNLLMDERCPKIGLGVMVSAWDHMLPDDGDYKQFEKLFPESGFNFDTIRQKASKLAFLHSADDPHCPLEQAEYLAKNLNAPLTIIQNGDHLGDQFPQFPQLWR
ncbi:MAG: alpha/beta hydrolase [Candidatus Saccharimonadales bacterium]